MQEMHPKQMTAGEAYNSGKMMKEIFTGATDTEVRQKMEARAEKLKRKGLVLHRRSPITDIPLAIRDLAAECATAVNRAQRRRLRKELHKLVDAL